MSAKAELDRIDYEWQQAGFQVWCHSTVELAPIPLMPGQFGISLRNHWEIVQMSAQCGEKTSIS